MVRSGFVLVTNGSTDVFSIRERDKGSVVD